MINVLNCREYIEAFLKIRDKKGRLVPLRLNPPQLRLYSAIAERRRAGKAARVIILKARQMGFSTLSEAVIFWATATRRNTDSMIIAHKDEATANLFRMSRLFYENLPQELQPLRAASNAQELVFDRRSGDTEPGLGSRIRCATAGGKGQGRSYTLRNVHMSEFAFWPGDKLETYSGIMQAVPDDPDTLVIIESTANGFDDFKKLWDLAVEQRERGDDDGFIPVFFPWYEMPEYRRPVPAGFERTAEEEELAAAHGLNDEQLAWRRWCIATNCGGDLTKFRQEYPATPEEAFVTTGTCVFDSEAILLRIAAVEKDDEWERGQFEFYYDGLKISRIKWTPCREGIIRIRKKPEEGRPYVIGGDTAGTGSDSFVGQVLDNTSGEQVAVLQHLNDETLYARQMYCLGKYYNNALLGIETNYSTYPVMELERLGYTHQYVRESLDSYTGKLSQAYGFVTTQKNRQTMIDNLKAVARDDLRLIADRATLGEMLTFIYNEKYRPEAQAGEHDDLVMALAIAHEIRGQQRSTIRQKPGKGARWTKDQWEDYRQADAAGRKHLLSKWGTPNKEAED